MDNYDNQTICALATAVGGAIAVIRLSGPSALSAATRCWQPAGGKPLSRQNARRMMVGAFRDSSGEHIDSQCLAVYMPGPNSYTGEDVVEFHLHGGAFSARMALDTLQELPSLRLASPGEFTRRAFLNGKMDLTQAEAVAEMLQSESEAALRCANRQLSGELRQVISRHFDAIEAILSEVDARIDFPEEEIDWSETETLLQRISTTGEALNSLAASAREGEVLRTGVTLVIAGAPNVGKSSLLNRLLGRERAIVSAIPGTTRDTIEADLVLKGIPFHLIDTAGLHTTADVIEQSGIQRAKAEAAAADIVLWVTDATQPPTESFTGYSGTLLRVVNKCDLASPTALPPGAIALSAKTGQGVEQLVNALESAALGGTGRIGDHALTINSRHATLLRAAIAALEESQSLLQNQEWELAAIPLRRCRQALGEIIGRSVSADLLDHIFHHFCIGK